VEKDCQACKLNTEDTIGHSRWRKKKLIKNVYGDEDGWEWVVCACVILLQCPSLRQFLVQGKKDFISLTVRQAKCIFICLMNKQMDH